jgi:hypothetical protein
MARRVLPFAARTESTMSNSPTRSAKGQARATCSMFLRSPCPSRSGAASLRPGCSFLLVPCPHRHPERGVDGAPTGALFCHVARARRDLRALRRGLSRSERDLSRRSTMAIFGRGPTPPPPGVKDRSRQRLVRKPQGLAEGPLTSHVAVRAAVAGRHSPLRLQDRLRRRPS